MEPEAWIEAAWKAALTDAAPSDPPVDAARAVASNLYVGLQGWPGSEEERAHLTDYFRKAPRASEDEIRALRERVRELMLDALQDRYISYERKRYALLALANLFVLGIGDAETLKHFDGAHWLTPGLRDYVRDALLGPSGLGEMLLRRNSDLEREIHRTPAPSSPPPRVDSAGLPSAGADATADGGEPPQQAFARALAACGVRPLTVPEPDPVRAALRIVLRTLLLDGWHGLPDEVREWVLFVGISDERPSFARYVLARALTERPGLPFDEEWEDEHGRHVRSRTWKRDDDQRAFMGETDPQRPPRLAPHVAGAAITLLALVEVEEVRASPSSRTGTHNAFNVLGVVAAEPRWPEGIRRAMEDVSAQRIEDSARFARHVELLALLGGRTVSVGPGTEGDAAATVPTGAYFDHLETKAAAAFAGHGPPLTKEEHEQLTASIYRRGAATQLEAARLGAKPAGTDPAEEAAPVDPPPEPPIEIDARLLDATDDGKALRLGTHDLFYMKSDGQRRVTIKGAEGRLMLSLVRPGGVPAHVRSEAVSHLRSALEHVDGRPVLLEGKRPELRLSSRVRMSDRLNRILEESPSR